MKGRERHNPVAAASKESVTQRKSSCRISLLAQHHVWDLYLLPTRHFYSKSCYWWPLSSSSSATSPSLSDEDDYNDQVGNNHVLRRIIARWAQVTYVMFPPFPPTTPNDKSTVERVWESPVIITLPPLFTHTHTHTRASAHAHSCQWITMSLIWTVKLLLGLTIALLAMLHYTTLLHQ